MKQEKIQPCDCKEKEKKLKQKIIFLEDKNKAKKLQLSKKDSEIELHIIENQKLKKKISEFQKPKYSEYVELPSDWKF